MTLGNAVGLFETQNSWRGKVFVKGKAQNRIGGKGEYTTQRSSTLKCGNDHGSRRNNGIKGKRGIGPNTQKIKQSGVNMGESRP